MCENEYKQQVKSCQSVSEQWFYICIINKESCVGLISHKGSISLFVLHTGWKKMTNNGDFVRSVY